MTTSVQGSQPQSPGVRICCMLAKELTILPFGLKAKNNIFDPTTMESEHMSGGGDGVGIVYTCAAGFVDLGHTRDLVDMTRYYYQHLVKGSRTIKPLHYPGAVSVLSDPETPDDAFRMARGMAYEESVFHEIETYWLTAPGCHNSAFSPEDLPSNYLGTFLGEQALRGGGIAGDFDTAVTSELDKLLVDLGALDTAGTLDAFSKIEGSWISSSLHWSFARYLRKRNLAMNPVQPWKVAGVPACATTPTSVPQDLNWTLHAPVNGSYQANFEIPYWKAMNDTRREKLGGTYLLNNQFQAKIAEIRANAKVEYGPGADSQ